MTYVQKRRLRNKYYCKTYMVVNMKNTIRKYISICYTSKRKSELLLIYLFIHFCQCKKNIGIERTKKSFLYTIIIVCLITSASKGHFLLRKNYKPLVGLLLLYYCQHRRFDSVRVCH